MKGGSLDSNTLHLLVRNLPSGGVAVLIQFGSNRQIALGRHRSDQAHDHLVRVYRDWISEVLP